MNKERPVLENLIKEHMSAIELFQNQTLRPVIKMQHDLLIASFSNYIQKRKLDFSSLTDSKKRTKIRAVFVKDIHYKNFYSRQYYWSFFYRGIPILPFQFLRIEQEDS